MRVHQLEQRVQALERLDSNNLDVDMGSDLHDTTINSMSSLECSDTSDAADDSYDQFYIGEAMVSTASQTELAANPNDRLAYFVDPAMLVQAGVNNALLDLQRMVQENIQEAETLLNAPCFTWYDDADVWSSSLSECVDPVVQIDASSVESDVRLCSLRLEKVQKLWTALYNDITMECTVQSLSDDDCYSLFMAESTALCEDIGAIMLAQHTIGTWSNGQAVFAVLMDRFGVEEGKDAVIAYMAELGIPPDEVMKPVLSLALEMLINNRCNEC